MGTHDNWIGRKVRINKLPEYFINTKFNFLLNEIGTIQRYATDKEVNPTDFTHSQFPYVIFLIDVSGKPVFASPDYLELIPERNK